MPAPRFQRAGRICQGLSVHPDRVGSGEGAGVRPQGIHSHLKNSLKKNFFFKPVQKEAGPCPLWFAYLMLET